MGVGLKLSGEEWDRVGKKQVFRSWLCAILNRTN